MTDTSVPKGSGDVAQQPSLSDFTDAELQGEVYRRATNFLGDPVGGVSVPSTHCATDPLIDRWSQLPPVCQICKGAGRMGVMACNDCGATGQAPISADRSGK